MHILLRKMNYGRREVEHTHIYDSLQRYTLALYLLSMLVEDTYHFIEKSGLISHFSRFPTLSFRRWLQSVIDSFVRR